MLEEEHRLSDYSTAVGLEPYEKLRVNAEKIGGITRFIQHAPRSVDAVLQFIDGANKEDFICIANVYDIHFSQKDHEALPSIIPTEVKKQLKNVVVDRISQKKILPDNELSRMSCLDKIKEKLATANVCFHSIFLDNVPYIYVETILTIQPGEQLLISYGDSYFNQKGMMPHYFNKHTGNIIPRVEYLPSREDIFQKYPKAKRDINHTFRYAVYNNDLVAVHTLLQYGDVDVNQASPSGKTPLSLVGTNSNIKKTEENKDISGNIAMLLQAVIAKMALTMPFFGQKEFEEVTSTNIKCQKN